jgi:hypothetical protein
MQRFLLLLHNLLASTRPLRPGTHYPHVTWAHVMLRVHLWYFNFEFWRSLTLLSLCLHHVIWHGDLVGSRANTPLKFIFSHIFRETWRTCRVLFRYCYQLFPEIEEMLIEKVRQRTFLYDTKIPDYRDQHMRANAREEIGKESKIKCKSDVTIVCPRLNAIRPGTHYPHVTWVTYVTSHEMCAPAEI